MTKPRKSETKPRKAGGGRKRADGTQTQDEVSKLSLSEKLDASIQGRFSDDESMLAEIVMSFIALGKRLKKSQKKLELHTIDVEVIKEATAADLPQLTTLLAKSLATLLCKNVPNVSGILATVSRVLAARSPNKLGKLRPANPIHLAAVSLGHWALAFSGCRDSVDPSFIAKLIERMPPKNRLAEMRKLGAIGDDKTLKKALREIWGCEFKRGAPKGHRN